MLELKHIKKIYNPGMVTEMTLFEDFSLKVDDGEFVAIVGSNGSGKTSMLNIICGSIPVESGEILIDGKNVTRLPEFKRYRSIGRIFQNPAVSTCPDLTLLENMALADNKGKLFALQRGIPKARIDYYREQLAGLRLGLEDKLGVRMGAFSGGQRQAVAMIMATLSPLSFLILDEHTAALDPATADLIMELTDRVVREKKLTALMVTHNLRYAVEYGTRTIMMDKGRAVLDVCGEERKNLSVHDLLGLFNKISIECGN
jgi:ABC-type uncharacterized transport system, ATPase component